MILCGNKCDLLTEEQLFESWERLEDFAKENGFIGTYIVSVKFGINIEEMIIRLSKEMMYNDN